MGKTFFLLFISIFYAAGFGMLWHGINSAKQSVEASNWTSVTGTITNLSLRENSDSDGTTYGVEVEYRYSVMGRTYTSSRLAFGYASSSGRQAHQDIFNKLEQASSVKIRYNPQNPAASTLSFGIHRSVKLILAFAITWLGTCKKITSPQKERRGGEAAPPLFLWGCLKLADPLAFIFGFTLIWWMASQPDDVLLKNMEVTLKR
jgi:hypothetical protein